MFRSNVAAVLAGAAVGISQTAVGANAAVAGGLAPHRAVYDVQLKDASERSGIEGMRGRLVYEFVGDECAGYTTNFRFVTQIDTGDDIRVTDQQSVTFEDIAAGKFRFESKSFTDDQLDKDVSGLAAELSDGVRVELSEPETRTVEIASSQFPAEHLIELIGRARKGKTFFEARLFDGSEEGDRSYLTTTFVGDAIAPNGNDPEAVAAGDLSKSSYWPVSIAYFEEGAGGDQTPVYTQSFKLHENGVTRDLTLDYGDFVLTGRLTSLDILGDGECR